MTLTKLVGSASSDDLIFWCSAKVKGYRVSVSGPANTIYPRGYTILRKIRQHEID